MDERNMPCYFLGTNMPNGYISFFPEMYDPDEGWRCTILKGGPGCGKSTIMRKIAEAAQNRGEAAELVYCSSDPKSLDAVILPQARRCIADGTAPHILDPVAPGACETLFNPGDCWDSRVLFAHRTELRKLNAQIAAHHRRATRMKATAVNLLNEARMLAADAVQQDRLERYLSRLCARLFRGLPRKKGNEYKRFLSGVTPNGFILYTHTLTCCANHITLIADHTETCAPLMLTRIRDAALAHGCSTIVCYSPLRPTEPDAVILPDRSEAFAASTTLLHYDFIPERTIHTRRFLDPAVYAVRRNAIRLRRKLAFSLMDDVYAQLRCALQLHDQLEDYYKAAMDFDKLNAQTDRLLQEFWQ